MSSGIKGFATTPAPAPNHASASASASASHGPGQFVLSEDQSRSIFEQSIVKDELAHLEHLGHLSDGVQPIAVVIAGQTGAGKTRLAPVLWQAMTDKGLQPAHFIADVYKTYHPQYASIIRESPALASPATGTDARRWLEMACNWAIRRRLDVLLESACRHPDDFTTLLSAFHHGGYKVHVAILAVPECLSLLGIMVRYYKKLPEARSGNLPLRLTPRKVHYDTYDGLLRAADFVDKSSAADAVIVVRRNNLVAYQNSRDPEDGEWCNPSAALACLDLERSRPLPASEHAAFFADCQFIDEHANDGDRGSDARLADIESSLAALNTVGHRASTAFPALKPLDCAGWLFGK